MFGSTAVHVPQNWKSSIDQVLLGYMQEPAKGLEHGFQKDGIQNGWGARTTKEGSNWGMRFSLVENKKGTFLSVEDWGTTGMTGPNMNMNEISESTTDLPPDYKLARFSAMNYSGGNEGAGLFGRGKLLFSAVSENYSLFFETLTEEEGYRANYKSLRGNALMVNPIAFEEEEGRNFIKEQTGLEPIDQIGSRIIIVSPKQSVIDEIKNGQFLNHIEETWWRILDKYDANIFVEYGGTTFKAKVPEEYISAMQEVDGWKAWRKKDYQLPNYHKVQKLEVYVSDDEIPEELQGLAFYRRDMKIGQIDVNIPVEVKGKFFGFIEVDDKWEQELALNEDLEHYSVVSKSKKCYQKLKNEVGKETNLFLEEIGIIKSKKNENERLREELNEISKDLDTFFNDINVTEIGTTGSKKTDITVSWGGMDFPDSNKKGLVTGDIIRNIRFKVKNNSGVTRKIEYKLNVLHQDTEVYTVATSLKNISGSTEEVFGPYDLKIDTPLVRYEKNILNLEISYNKKKIIKQIPLYYDTAPIAPAKKKFVIKNSSITFPETDSRRVNTGEKLQNISYIIENNTSEKAYIAFHFSTHNVESNNDLIESVLLKKDIVLNAYDKLEIGCPEIDFNETYESKLDKGKIEVRARISASQDFSEYEIAEELSLSKLIVHFNDDPSGVGSTFTDIVLYTDENGKRSDLVDGNRVFALYVKHPAYERVINDEEHRREYVTEEMLKQMIRAHIEEGNYSILDIDGEHENPKELEELSDLELMQKIYYTVDKLQFKRLKN